MRYNFRGVVADPEECEMEDLTELKNLEDDLEGPVLAVFCVATYGEGDPTDNAQAFFDWLQEGTASVNGENFKILIFNFAKFRETNKEKNLPRNNVIEILRIPRGVHHFTSFYFVIYDFEFNIIVIRETFCISNNFFS